MKTKFQVKKLSFFLASALILSAQVSADDSSLCYIPGAGGGSDYALKQMSKDLAARGVRSITFDVGKTGSVQLKAQRLRDQIQLLINSSPEFRCHFIGYSQGAIVLRYALNHLTLQEPQVGNVSFQKVALSFTSASSPHRGTPLAKIGRDFLGDDFEEGFRQMSEEEMVYFNEPKYPETYSPIIESIPTYSYRTFLNNGREGRSLQERLGYEAIKSYLSGRRRKVENDGVVPFESMPFGKVLNTFNVPHSFFSTGVSKPQTLVDVLVAHDQFVRGLLANLPLSYPQLFQSF